MRFDLIPPKDQLALFMARVYEHGMTTTSGGNLSILDEDGSLWITPAATDKGQTKPEDIVRVDPNGAITGPHRPSSEYPFHRAVYEKRPDLRGLVHAHPSALVAFSIIGEVPDTRLIPQAESVCGEVGFAPYELPGSPELGESIAETFARGHDCILLENHGVVCGGKDLPKAFEKFETLEFCARLIIRAKMLGELTSIGRDQRRLFDPMKSQLPEFEPGPRARREKELRSEMTQIMRRAYRQELMTSSEGTLSARIEGDTFLISPFGVDRKWIEMEDFVLIHAGKREPGRSPSRAVHLHRTIYQTHPWVQSIVTAQAPNITAFGLVEKTLETRTIPESYILLRDIPKVPFGPQYDDEQTVASAISERTPVVILQNDAVLVTGGSLLEAFDRLEVAEFTACSVIDAISIGKLKVIEPSRIVDLNERFNLP